LRHHLAASEHRGEDHDERADHVIRLLGVLMRDEELPWLVDQQVVERGLQTAGLGQPELAAKVIQVALQGLVSRTLIAIEMRPFGISQVSRTRRSSRVWSL
jgi:hypothetical protein